VHAGSRDWQVRFEAERADGIASTELQRAFLADIVSRYPSFDPRLGPSAHPSEFTHPYGIWLVAYVDERPVGCGGLKRLDQRTAEVKRLFLNSSVRGRGLGHRLLEELERHASRLGYSRIRLDTGDKQPAALGLFRSCGYTEIADYNRNPFAAYWLEKQLR
jgi:GNAT superfamily N-acetyltransferase